MQTIVQAVQFSNREARPEVRTEEFCWADRLVFFKLFIVAITITYLPQGDFNWPWSVISDFKSWSNAAPYTRWSKCCWGTVLLLEQIMIHRLLDDTFLFLVMMKAQISKLNWYNLPCNHTQQHHSIHYRNHCPLSTLGKISLPLVELDSSFWGHGGSWQ